MKNILLLLSTTRQSPKTIAQAFKRAKEEKANLLALFVVDSTIPEMIVSKVTDIGFLGEKPSEEFREAIIKEYQRRGVAKLKEISNLAASDGLKCETRLVKGDFLEDTLKVVQEQRIDYVILNRAMRSDLARFFFRLRSG